MQEVTVPKGQLIERLTHNRDKHRAIFERAQEVYREKMIAELDRALEEARAGRQIQRAFMLPVPEDHTDDFNTAIQMLEWEVGGTITVSGADFRRYVLNDWEWRDRFYANTESYLVQ